ncbi:hypothetical protein L1275_000880 [Flavobacterium sp. HSC-61S13]|nr:hypothetical protein [Flavobacterium sp. HSC-61S13]
MNKDRFKVIVGASFSGICFATYLLYSRRGGYLATNDYLSLVVLVVFVMCFLVYLKKKKF